MRWWSGLDDRGRAHASVLALLCVGYIGHYLVFCIPQPFFIEDAGISFAYARNLIDGEGLVPYPGAERVEGFSNPLWTYLIALLYAVGIPTWTAGKLLGAVFGVLTLPLSYGIVRRARPHGTGDVALAAPLLLAASPQFVIWNASGLENSLFCLLLAAGIHRILAEMHAADEGGGGRPWSALMFVLLAMTRPEGMVYAGIAAAALFLDAAARRRLGLLGGWLVAFAVPFGLYHLWRYWYFAWTWPNTYYAKLGRGTTFKPYKWDTSGWKYVNNYLLGHGVVYVLPLLALALTGLKKRRWLAFGLLPILAVLVFWDGAAGLPELPDWWKPVKDNWIRGRVWSIAAACVLLGLATLGRSGWRARGILWCCTTFGVFFALYAGGDWMKQHRWFNLISVSLFPLLAIGLGEMVDAIPADLSRWRPPKRLRGLFGERVPTRLLVLLVPCMIWIGSEARHSYAFAMNPETAVRDINRRVAYMSWVQRRLDLDHVVLMDVDMGAHMYYSGWDILDFAGLIDVPVARHSDYAKPFMRQYVFEERKPHFAHVHAGWARTSKIPKHREWRREYLEIPGYPIGGRKLHIGNHIRRDTFITRTGPLPEGVVRFEGNVQLVRFDVPSPVVAPGSHLFLDTTWRARLRDHGFRLLVFLDGPVRTVQAFPPGWDWYGADKWKATEEVSGRFWMALPDDLPLGDYQMGVVLLDEETGAVLAPRRATDAPEADVRYLPGELLLDEITVTVSAEHGAAAAAEDDLEDALGKAAQGWCDKVWPAWKDATRHRLTDEEWIVENEPEVRSALAACWVGQAASAQGALAKAELLAKARRWDHRLDELREMARPLAEELDASGTEKMASKDWKGAYLDFSAALSIDAQRPWTRRRAEAARDKTLGIQRPEGSEG